MNVPDGIQSITAEGGDLKGAMVVAAQELGVHPAQLDYKLDLSHFRSSAGMPLARNTVRIVAWLSGREAPDPNAPEPVRARPERSERPDQGERPDRGERPERAERPERGERPERRERSARPAAGADREEGRGRRRRDDDRPRERSRDERPREEDRERSKPGGLQGAEAGTTEASAFAEAWFSQLLSLMDVEGTATGTGSEARVHLAIKAERAGRIVGKRGATLGSIRHLLALAVENKFGELNIDVDVGDDRPREDRGPRDRDRDRTSNGSGRSARGGRGGDRRPRDRDRAGAERGRYPEEKLRALARRAAEKALETTQTITINLELNSFDRRLVHLEVSEMDGVESHSEERTGDDGRTVKFIQIVPLLT